MNELTSKPAFPQYAPHPDDFAHGMTLRDYFAAKAMQALIWNPDIDLESKEDVAEVAYAYADTMLKARAA